ncbi:leucine-rich repeat extensin-like protein 3 [Iris pallida]|uniref:Leucine-rich repeat extensin-like protein 3 n=1 Tax=Iris pallida TaxID=29817 RepID=A0AAX6GCK5_IRIPA|nr:leucine-rich repeat extensin-like protein 3 [Iris pallida]
MAAALGGSPDEGTKEVGGGSVRLWHGSARRRVTGRTQQSPSRGSSNLAVPVASTVGDHGSG